MAQGTRSFRHEAAPRLSFSFAGFGADGSAGSFGQTKEPGARPMRSGNPFSDHGQRAIMRALIFKPVIANENGVGMPAPLTDQSRAHFRDERGIEGLTFLCKFSGQGLKAAPQCPVRPASSTLLQLMGEGADQQIATEPRRRAGAMQFAPRKPQFLRRAIEQFGNLTVDLGDLLTGRLARAVAASTGNRRRLARVLASQCVVGWRPHAFTGSAIR